MQQRLCGPDVPGRDAREAQGVDRAEARDAGDAVGMLDAQRPDDDPVADLVVLLRGRPGVDDDVAGPASPVAALQPQRAEARVGGADSGAEPFAGVLLAVASGAVGPVGPLRCLL